MLDAHQKKLEAVSRINENMAISIEQSKAMHNKILKSELKTVNQKIDDMSWKILNLKNTLQQVA